MTDRVVSIGVRALVMLALASAAAGCVASGDEGFTVLNNSAPSGACEFTGATTQPSLASGHILTISPVGYQLSPLIQSKITAKIGQESQKTISILGGRIDLSFEAITLSNSAGVTMDLLEQQSAKVDAGLLKFKQLRSASLPPGGSTNVNFEVIPWAVIPQVLSGITLMPGDRFHALLVAKLVMYGEMNGEPLDSDPFTYPIEICNDCIANIVGPCPARANVMGNACNPYQDGSVDCCVDTANRLVCPASAQ
jgi:hypothetical protein